MSRYLCRIPKKKALLEHEISKYRSDHSKVPKNLNVNDSGPPAKK